MPAQAKHMEDIIEAMSIKYNNRVYEIKQSGQDVIVLSFGEAYFDVPLLPFDDLPFPAVYHYSHSRGISSLRTKLCDYYRTRYGVNASPDSEIVITAGSKIAIFMALLSIVNPGDEVIIPEPTWVSYTEQLKLCHATPVLVDSSVPVKDLERYVTSKTKAIIICNPNNPSGQRFSEADMLCLHDLALKHDLYLLSDEAYSDYFLPGHQFISAGFHDQEKKHTIICNSMSKNFGISGWRIGYVITNSTLLNQILKINQHLVTCPATILEMYLDKHFEFIIDTTESQIKEVVAKRASVKKLLSSHGLQCMPGDATFYLFVSIEPSSLSSEQFATRLLEEYHVSTVAGIGYGNSCDRFVRISVGNESIERITQGLSKIRQLIDATSVSVHSATAAVGSAI